MKTHFSRRTLLLAAATAALLAACAGTPQQNESTPIVFVHGNGDTAALWHTTIWRFESNGWPRERLHAIDLPYPLARDADDQPQPGRTSTAEHMQYLSAEVDKVLKATGAAKVSHAVIGGGTSHGAWNNPGFRPTNEPIFLSYPVAKAVSPRFGLGAQANIRSTM
jgi:triacylglycerol esterase/lipase EstA (alpha/beta hydrolase family)